MMGKCTYPVLKEDAPRQHVETFFQVGMQVEIREGIKKSKFPNACKSMQRGKKPITERNKIIEY